MGLKKKSKVSAEFNMSSLTDIIFLLLIFFMLTSSLINPNAINLKLPSSSKVRTPTSPSNLTKIRVGSTGKFYVNGKRANVSSLESTMRKLAQRKGKSASVILEWNSKTGVEHVVTVMDLALKYHVNTILAAEK